LSIWTSGRGVAARGSVEGGMSGEFDFDGVLVRGDGGVVAPFAFAVVGVVVTSRCVTFKVPIYRGINGRTN
jgi:hypothetical protein